MLYICIIVLPKHFISLKGKKKSLHKEISFSGKESL